MRLKFLDWLNEKVWGLVAMGNTEIFKMEEEKEEKKRKKELKKYLKAKKKSKTI